MTAKPYPQNLNPAHDAAVKHMLTATQPKNTVKRAVRKKVQRRRPGPRYR
jgi:hypothetical protein